MADQQMPPGEAIMQMASGLWLSRALWAACHLRIPDAIDGEARSVAQIAAAAGVQAGQLRRLLRTLSAFGVFAPAGEDGFVHTPLSRILRSDEPGSQRAFVDSIFGGEHYDAWGVLDESVVTGRTAFDIKFGMPAFDYLGQRPEKAILFGEAMTATTRMVEAAVFAAHAFKPFDLAVDVGGSEASLLRGVLRVHENARGIVFDLPATVEAGRRAWESTPEGPRIRGEGGDFFKAVPEGDLYLLKFILHDWTDEQSSLILRNIRRAIRPHGRIAIVEMVIPHTPTPHAAWLMDINMMAMTGGRERSVAEFQGLLEAAGFRLDGVTTTASPVGVVEAVVA